MVHEAGDLVGAARAWAFGKRKLSRGRGVLHGDGIPYSGTLDYEVMKTELSRVYSVAVN